MRGYIERFLSANTDPNANRVLASGGCTLPEMSAYDVAVEIQASGKTIPAGVVAGIAMQVAEVSGQKVPSTIALKRTFISNWFQEFGQKLLNENAPPAISSGGGSSRGGGEGETGNEQMSPEAYSCALVADVTSTSGEAEASHKGSGAFFLRVLPHLELHFR